MDSPRHLTTARLRLDAVCPDDLDEHFALLSDPRVWEHRPSGRHCSPEQTAAAIDAQTTSWARVGLGYWTARLRNEGAAPTGLDTDALVGIGGCAVRDGSDWWNLYYRLARPAWGRGLATELARAAMRAARDVEPGRPVVAYLLEHNVGSRRVAERLGLSLVWRGPDAGNPDANSVRLIYTDRPITDDLIGRVAALP